MALSCVDPRARRARGSSRGRLVRAALLLLHAVTICLALQLSGIVHFAIDLWQGPEAAHHETGCPDQGGDQDCPPGCPSCHCVHTIPGLPVPFAALAPSKLLPAFEMTWAPYDRDAPPCLDPPSVYRPPRA